MCEIFVNVHVVHVNVCFIEYWTDCIFIIELYKYLLIKMEILNKKGEIESWLQSITH